MKRKAANRHVCLEWFQRLKCRATGLDASLSRSCSQMRFGFTTVWFSTLTANYAEDTISGSTSEMSSDVNGSFRSRILFALEMKGNVLRRTHTHLNVPGRSTDIRVPLTNNLLMSLCYLK